MIELDLRVAIVAVVNRRVCDVFFRITDKVEGRMYGAEKFFNSERANMKN